VNHYGKSLKAAEINQATTPPGAKIKDRIYAVRPVMFLKPDRSLRRSNLG